MYKNEIVLTVFFMLLFIGCREKSEKSIISNGTMKQTDYVLNKKLSLNDYSNYKGFISKDGFVPNEKIAFQIAEIVLSQIYGKDIIEREKPFSINLDGNVWIIEGSLPKEYDRGGSAYIEINKQTGQILKVIHTK